MRLKKLAVVDRDCVACGNCIKYCPRAAIDVVDGLTAVVDGEKCVGCGKCVVACPAGVISCVERGEMAS